MVLATPIQGLLLTANLTFQLFVSPDPITSTTANTPTGSDNSTTIIIISSIGGGLVFIGVIALVILYFRRKHKKQLGDNGK